MSEFSVWAENMETAARVIREVGGDPEVCNGNLRVARILRRAHSMREAAADLLKSFDRTTGTAGFTLPGYMIDNLRSLVDEDSEP